jgi:hypothetical protein
MLCYSWGNAMKIKSVTNAMFEVAIKDVLLSCRRALLVSARVMRTDTDHPQALMQRLRREVMR